MAPKLLLDIGCLCDAHTDSVLESMFKAIGDGPDDGIWEPHPNPFIRRIVELFSERGLDRIAGIRDELGRWLDGSMHAPGAAVERPAGAMERWGPQELGVVKLYLETLPPGEWTLDDWMLCIDYLVQRYLPAGDLRSEADWLATRSGLMGRVEAAMGTIALAEADRLLASLPTDLASAYAELGINPAHQAIIEFGRARCGENVVSLTDALRHKLRKLVVDHQEAVYLGDLTQTREALQTKLLDTFGSMNRDWRRIAVTEAGENANQGFIATLAPGTKIKRVEMYRGACPFCRSIDGRLMTVVEPGAANKDGASQVWIGKTNAGRSLSPRKRVEGELVERDANERLWVAAGTMHPHCRGSWVKAGRAAPDPIFDDWLAELERRPKAVAA